MDWLGSLAVVLIGAVLAHCLAIRRSKLTARRTAAAKFRGSILATLNGLYPLPVNWPDDIDHTLRRAFPTLQTPSRSFVRSCLAAYGLMIVRGSAIAVRLAATSIFNATIITWIFGVLMNLQQMLRAPFMKMLAHFWPLLRRRREDRYRWQCR